MSKVTSFWNLQSDSKRPGILNMYVYGRITSSSHWLFGSDTDVTASQFVKDLQRFKDIARINLYINSPGGDVFVAAAVRNQLRAHTADVHAYIDGLCASAATTLATGANTVHMSRSALMMMHNPSTRIEGEVKDFEKGIEVLGKVKATILSVYKEKTGLSDETLSALMDKESWYTADEAKEIGLVDDIIEDAGLKVENTEKSIVINGVPVVFGDEEDLYKVGSFCFANTLSREKLEAKLLEVNNQQGGTTPMSFEAIRASLKPEQQTILDTYVQDKVTEAVNAKQTEFDATTQQYEDRIKDLTKDAPAGTDNSTNSEDAVLNALPADVKQMVLDARANAAAAEAKLAEAEKATALANFKESMKAYSSLPLTDDHVNALYALSTADKANFEKAEALLKVANEAMAAGFKPTGDDNGKDAPTDAAAKLDDLIASAMKEDGKLNYKDALNKVSAEHPELYRSYRDER